MILLGMPIDEAQRVLNQNEFECEIVPYLGKKPYTKNDTARVIRQKKLSEKKYQLVFSNFISVPAENSQDR